MEKSSGQKLYTVHGPTCLPMAKAISLVVKVRIKNIHAVIYLIYLCHKNNYVTTMYVLYFYLPGHGISKIICRVLV